MSLRLEMLQLARLARSVLGDEACDLVEAYVRSLQNPDGGFRDRDGEGFERAGPGDGLRAARNAWWESGESVFVPTEVTERREVDLGDWSRASEIAGIGSLGPAHQRMRTWAAASKRWVWARGVGIALVAVGLGLSWLTFGPALRRRRGFRLEV